MAWNVWDNPGYVYTVSAEACSLLVRCPVYLASMKSIDANIFAQKYFPQGAVLLGDEGLKSRLTESDLTVTDSGVGLAPRSEYRLFINGELVSKPIYTCRDVDGKFNFMGPVQLKLLPMLQQKLGGEDVLYFTLIPLN
jgi:hypothetical protein